MQIGLGNLSCLARFPDPICHAADSCHEWLQPCVGQVFRPYVPRSNHFQVSRRSVLCLSCDISAELFSISRHAQLEYSHLPRYRRQCFFYTIKTCLASVHVKLKFILRRLDSEREPPKFCI